MPTCLLPEGEIQSPLLILAMNHISSESVMFHVSLPFFTSPLKKATRSPFLSLPSGGPGSTQPRTQARARRAFGTSRRLVNFVRG